MAAPPTHVLRELLSNGIACSRNAPYLSFPNRSFIANACTTHLQSTPGRIQLANTRMTFPSTGVLHTGQLLHLSAHSVQHSM